MKILIVSALHGDEEIIDEKQLYKLKEKTGADVCIANYKALEKKKRFIDTDMNRCFNCENPKTFEELVAVDRIKPMLKNYDLVIDVHATKCDMPDIAIVTSLNKKVKDIIKYVPIKNIVQMPKEMGKGSLIKHCKIGISLEYKRGTKPDYVIAQIKKIIGQKKEYQHNFYKVIGEYVVDEPFKPSNALQELKEVKKPVCLGTTAKTSYNGEQGLIPLFTGKGRYKGTACLKLKKFN